MNNWLYNFDADYEYDFSFMNTGSKFPTTRMLAKNTEYRFRKKEFSGSYGFNRSLVAMVNKIEKHIPYKLLTLNYFKLLTNKIVDLIFNNEVIIKCGDNTLDTEINNLVEKTDWLNGIRKAVKYVTIYGDSCLKTFKNGVSVFSPLHAFKVVNSNNVDDVKGYVLYNTIIEKRAGKKVIEYIKFEIHIKGFIYECVKEYIGGFNAGTIGKSVDYIYNNRKIPKEGLWYNTGVNNCELVQWLSINIGVDDVYGESVYQDIQDIVFALEHRISMEHHALNSLADPLLIVGMSSVIEDENGNYKLKTVNGNMIVTEDRNNDKAITPQSFQQDFKLDVYSDFIDQLKSELYELSELGRVFLSSEYSGNISEESISNLIKGAIDKATRILNDVYYKLRDSLYVLAVLNNINIKKEEITIVFNMGQTDSDKNVAEVCQLLSQYKILSRQSLREKYFGYSKEQSDNEESIIIKEDKQVLGADDADSKLDNLNTKNLNINNKEEITNEI